MPANEIAAELERRAQGIEEHVGKDLEDLSKTLIDEVVKPAHGLDEFGTGFGAGF